MFARHDLLRLATRNGACRYLSTGSKPHAYLRPLTASKGDTSEFEGTMCLTMDRPDARNALSVQMVNELREGIAKTAASSAARLLLLHTPHAGMFCAGADLRERKTMSSKEVSNFLDALRSLLFELESLTIPTIAVVDGFALGGGTELALGCDIRVGGPGAKMALPETKLGIIPGAGGTQRLTHLIGASRAKELIFTGKRLDADEAAALGLLNVLAMNPQSAWEAALIMSKQILTSAPLALKAAKKAVSAATTLPLEQGLDLERKMADSLLGTQDRMEGLKAFAEKRKAVFTGQ